VPAFKDTLALIRRLRGVKLPRARRRSARPLQPDLIRAEYFRKLVAKWLAPARALIDRELMPVVERAVRERDAHQDAARLDATQVNSAMDRLAGRFYDDFLHPREVEGVARAIATKTADFNKTQVTRQARSALGVDVFAAEPNLAPVADRFVAANVALIKSLPSTYFADIEKAVTHGVQTGMRHEDIARLLTERYGVAENRAKLIARDQVGKYYGALSRARFKAMGVDGYIWRTVHDNRVRDEHAALDGQQFTWGSAPDGDPGEAVNCRCYADPVFAEDADEQPDAGDDEGDIDLSIEPDEDVVPLEAGEDVPEPTIEPEDIPPEDIAPPQPDPVEELERLRQEHEAELERLRQEHAAELERQRQAHEAEVEARREALRALLEQKKAEVEARRQAREKKAAEKQQAKNEQLADVAATIQSAGLTGTVALTTEQELVVRDKLSTVLKDYKMVNRDAQRFDGNSFSFENTLRQAADAVHTWGGRVIAGNHLRVETANALRLLAGPVFGLDAPMPTGESLNALRVVLHEAIHGHSPAVSTAYRAGGRVVEEVATELAARKITRDLFPGERFPTYAYDAEIDKVVDFVTVARQGKAGQQDRDAARKIVEDAALKYQRKGSVKATPEELVDHFVDGMKITPAQKGYVRGKIKVMR
jgi:SPP1 gp7 family putative phage head morphogenesis protein